MNPSEEWVFYYIAALDAANIPTVYFSRIDGALCDFDGDRHEPKQQ